MKEQSKKKVITPVNRKITWQMVYDDFERRHPNLSKRVSRWAPYDYAAILIYIKDGMILEYNYDSSTAVIITDDHK